MMILTNELRDYARSLFRTKPYHNPLTDIADDIDKDVDQLKTENDKLRGEGVRLLDKTLELASENDKLRELLRDTLIQTDQYCDKYGIEYEDNADAWDKADADIDRRLRELGVVK